MNPIEERDIEIKRRQKLEAENSRLKSLRPTSFKEAKESEAWKLRAELAEKSEKELEAENQALKSLMLWGYSRGIKDAAMFVEQRKGTPEHHSDLAKAIRALGRELEEG